MNSYERHLGMVNGDAVDIVPRIPILMQYAAEHIGSNYAEFASDFRYMVKANEQCAIDFGFDQLSTISDPYRETQGFGSEVEYVTDSPPRSTHPLEENRDLSQLKKPNPLQSERMFDRVKAVRAYQENSGMDYSILGWVEGPAAEAADLRDVINFLMDVLDDEVYSGELMDLCVEVALEFAKAQIESGADTIGIGDAIASQMSPDVYEKLIQPREKRLVKGIKEMGGIVKLHICGDITHLLSGIADLGIDVIDIDHMVDISQAREILGPKVVISGNIDPVEVLKSDNPESIIEKMKQIYETVGNPFMVNAGCEIPSGTPVENLKALCEPIPYQA